MSLGNIYNDQQVGDLKYKGGVSIRTKFTEDFLQAHYNHDPHMVMRHQGSLRKRSSQSRIFCMEKERENKHPYFSMTQVVLTHHFLLLLLNSKDLHNKPKMVHENQMCSDQKTPKTFRRTLFRRIWRTYLSFIRWIPSRVDDAILLRWKISFTNVLRKCLYIRSSFSFRWRYRLHRYSRQHFVSLLYRPRLLTWFLPDAFDTWDTITSVRLCVHSIRQCECRLYTCSNNPILGLFRKSYQSTGGTFWKQICLEKSYTLEHINEEELCQLHICKVYDRDNDVQIDCNGHRVFTQTEIFPTPLFSKSTSSEIQLR